MKSQIRILTNLLLPRAVCYIPLIHLMASARTNLTPVNARVYYPVIQTSILIKTAWKTSSRGGGIISRAAACVVLVPSATVTTLTPVSKPNVLQLTASLSVLTIPEVCTLTSSATASNWGLRFQSSAVTIEARYLMIYKWSSVQSHTLPLLLCHWRLLLLGRWQ